MTLTRRRLIAASTLTLAAAPAARANFQRPLRAIVPFPPGGGVDVFARVLAPALAAALGQPVVVENIGGASSRLGTQAVLRTPADGHTLLITNDTLAAIEALPVAGSGPFLPGLAPVLLGASAPQLLVTHPRSGLDSASTYAARLRERSTLNVGVPGLGSAQHFASELLAEGLGGRPEHIAYRGGGPLLTDLMAGVVDAGVVTLGAGIEQVRDGRLIALGVTSATRSAAAPDIPTFAERLLPGFEIETWMGVLVPVGTPPALLGALHQGTLAALRSTAVTQRLAALGFDTPGLGPDLFGSLLHQTAARYAAVAARIGLRAGDS